MKRLSYFLLLVILMIIQLNSTGQENPDTTKVYRIETNDGNTFTGFIMKEDEKVLILKTDKLGEITISQTDIKTKSEILNAKKVNDEYWLPNTQSSRYFWAPNGYGLMKGEAYYQNIWVLYNQVSFGLTNNFSFGFGTMPLFLIAGAPTPLWVVPKFSFPLVKDKINFGTGAFLGTLVGEDFGLFGLLYGTSTFGNRDKNFSLGLAYGFADGEWLNTPVINASGMIRTGPRGYFVTENYFISIDGEFVLLFSAGGRTMLRKIGLDYSLWIPLAPDMGTFIALPFLGITIPINAKSR